MEFPDIRYFIKECNEHNFPYRVVLCAKCERPVVGDCEQWPPRGMQGTEQHVWCEKCTNESVISSFVAPEDREQLWDILGKIKNGTLKNDTSVVVLYGDCSNGKTTLMRIMEKISPSYSSVPADFTKKKWNYSNPELLVLDVNKDTVFVSEQEPAKCDQTITDIQQWIRNQTGNIVRLPYGKEPVTIKPGVFVFAMNTQPSVELEKWRRNPIFLKMPNHFDNPNTDEVVQQGVEEVNQSF